MSLGFSSCWTGEICSNPNPGEQCDLKPATSQKSNVALLYVFINITLFYILVDSKELHFELKAN